MYNPQILYPTRTGIIGPLDYYQFQPQLAAMMSVGIGARELCVVIVFTHHHCYQYCFGSVETKPRVFTILFFPVKVAKDSFEEPSKRELPINVIGTSSALWIEVAAIVVKGNPSLAFCCHI